MNTNKTVAGIERDVNGIERDYYLRDKSRDILCSPQSRRRFVIGMIIVAVILCVVGYHIEAAKLAAWEETGVWQW